MSAKSDIRVAVEAHTDLNMYGAIIALLEGGLLYGGRHTVSNKIIRICKAEMQNQLRLYDAAMIRVAEGPMPSSGEGEGRKE